MSNIDEIQVNFAEKETAQTAHKLVIPTLTRGDVLGLQKICKPIIKKSIMSDTKRIGMPMTRSDVMCDSTKIDITVSAEFSEHRTVEVAVPIIPGNNMNKNRVTIKLTDIDGKHISGYTCVDFESRKIKNSYKALNKKLGEE